MRYVKVHYDAYNRNFKMDDGELSTELDDGGMYLVADFYDGEFLPPAALDFVEGDHTSA